MCVLYACAFCVYCVCVFVVCCMHVLCVYVYIRICIVFLHACVVCVCMCPSVCLSVSIIPCCSLLDTLLTCLVMQLTVASLNSGLVVETRQLANNGDTSCIHPIQLQEEVLVSQDACIRPKTPASGPRPRPQAPAYCPRPFIHPLRVLS